MVQESLRRVLTTSVRVKGRYTPVNRAPAYRHVNGLAHQGRVHVVAHRVTHDLGCVVFFGLGEFFFP